jgi:hypothetical protein
MKLFEVDLSSDLQRCRSEVEAALGVRRDLQRRGAEAVAAEPAFVSGLEEKRAAFAQAETAWALAADEAAERKLKATRERARGELAEAEDALKRVQILRNGVGGLVHDAEVKIIIAAESFDAALRPFCDEVLAQYRALLRRSLFSGDVPLTRALRLGYALLELPFRGSLQSVLAEVGIRDPGPAPGRPVPRFIVGDRAWADDDDLAGASLRDWHDDDEIVATHEILKPLSVTHATATVLVRQIKSRRAVEEEAQRRAAELAPKEPAPLPIPKTVSAEEFLASAPTAEEHRETKRREAAERTKRNFPGAGLAPRATWHGSRFADRNLA